MTRIGDGLAGRRVHVTQCDDFMGPALRAAFTDFPMSVQRMPAFQQRLKREVPFAGGWVT